MGRTNGKLKDIISSESDLMSVRIRNGNLIAGPAVVVEPDLIMRTIKLSQPGNI